MTSWYRKPKDLMLSPFALLAPGDVDNVDQALASLFETADRRCLEAVEWFLQDRRRRRFFSKALRLGVVVLGLIGSVLAILPPGADLGGERAGYVVLALAAGCLSVDRYFGFSQAWMRDMTAVANLQRLSSSSRLRWASACIGVATQVEKSSVDERLDILRAYVDGLDELLSADSADWRADFGQRLTAIEAEAGGNAQPTNV